MTPKEEAEEICFKLWGKNWEKQLGSYLLYELIVKAIKAREKKYLLKPCLRDDCIQKVADEKSEIYKTGLKKAVEMVRLRKVGQYIEVMEDLAKAIEVEVENGKA